MSSLTFIGWLPLSEHRNTFSSISQHHIGFDWNKSKWIYWFWSFDDYLVDLRNDLNDDGTGVDLDDDATIGVRDAEHEEEGIKAPVCFFLNDFDLFLESGLYFFICNMFLLRVVSFFLWIWEKWVVIFEIDIHLSFCKFCLEFHTICLGRRKGDEGCLFAYEKRK